MVSECWDSPANQKITFCCFFGWWVKQIHLYFTGSWLVAGALSVPGRWIYCSWKERFCYHTFVFMISMITTYKHIYINILSNVNVLSSRGLTLKHSLLFYILWIVSVLTSRVHKQLAFFLAVRSSVSSLLVPWAVFAALWINVYWMKPNEVHDLLLSAIPCFFWPVLDELCDTQEKRTERQTHPLAVGNESSLAGLFLHLHTNFVLKWSYDLFFRHWYMSSRIW